jgi:DtxR family Mn-dependent transcriptional regulator
LSGKPTSRGLPTEVTESAQNYLREIYKLEEDGDRATTTVIAERLGVSPPSATGMIKKLTALGLLEHVPYRGVVLTAAGKRVALEVTRHHRLLELYLVRALEIPLHAVHAEAHRLEHAISEDLERRIDDALGRPTHDPHGDPIPNERLEVEPRKTRALTDLQPGEEARVLSVPDLEEDLLRYLATIDLVPGQRVTLCRASPHSGALTLRVDGGHETAISRDLAEQIRIAA